MKIGKACIEVIEKRREKINTNNWSDMSADDEVFTGKQQNQYC